MPARTLLLLTITADLSLWVSAQTGNAPSAERGRRLSRKRMCLTSHRTDGIGGKCTNGPRHSPNGWPVDAIKTQLRNPRQDMPRCDEKLVIDTDLADINAVLATIKAGPLTRDIPLLSNL